MSKEGEGKYVVHKGRKPGRYDSWPDAKEQVERYPGNCFEKVDASSPKKYVVYEGDKPGVYDSWKEAHKQVSGCPGNIYERCDDGALAQDKLSAYHRK